MTIAGTAAGIAAKEVLSNAINGSNNNANGVGLYNLLLILAFCAVVALAVLAVSGLELTSGMKQTWAEIRQENTQTIQLQLDINQQIAQLQIRIADIVATLAQISQRNEQNEGRIVRAWEEITEHRQAIRNLAADMARLREEFNRQQEK